MTFSSLSRTAPCRGDVQAAPTGAAARTLGFPIVLYKEKDQKTLEELQKEQAENKRELEVEEAIQKDLPKDHPDKSSKDGDELREEIENTEGEIVGKIAEWLNNLLIKSGS